MDLIDTILNRVSVREFTDKNISETDLNKILKCAESGPSCVNSKDYEFIVITDKDKLNEIVDNTSHAHEPLRGANVGILICGNLDKAFEKAKDYFIIDCAIAGENICLSAKALGIGSVWLGVYPQEDRVNSLKKLFNLPPSIIPHSIIALGYPLKEVKKERNIDFEKIHYNKW